MAFRPGLRIALVHRPKSVLTRRALVALALLSAFALSSVRASGATSAASDAPPVSFRNDVMAVFAKAGCNAGACHGNKSGKGGFKLSLRGQDPDIDLDVLTRDLFARRTNPIEPDQSLLLLKATAQVPHEGGKRFGTDSEEYRTLRHWIAAGTPRDPAGAPTLQRLIVSPAEQVLVEPADLLRLTAVAVFSDGSSRDVSRQAVYEQSNELADIAPDGLVHRKRSGETTVLVRYLQCQEPVRLTFVPARPGFTWSAPPANNYIDEQIFAKLRTLRMNPSKDAPEGQYLRRAYLDLLGILPTADEAKAFLADTRPDKRARLVDALLARPEYADFWAMKWDDLLRTEERTLDRTGVQEFHEWTRRSIADNKPIDLFVRELVSARGSTYENPPANFYRALRDPVTRGEATAQLFLGARLQCAQCHNHPFDRWTQDDYYSWADVFARVDYTVLRNARRDNNDGHEFVGEQVVVSKTSGDVKNARTNQPATPRLLGFAAPLDDKADRLDALADWLVAPGNTMFARTQVNRIWANLMGRGIVDPVDDFRATNPPSHPALLDTLAKDFVAHGYDARYLIRLMMASRAYALSAEPNDTNADDEANYSHALPRRLTAEQLLDAQHQAAGVPTDFAGYDRGTRAGQIMGVQAVSRKDGKPTPSDQFLVVFGKPPRLISCDCERSNETTLNQTFQLVSGPEITAIVATPDNRIGRLLNDNKTTEQIVEELYWSALSRPPSAAEAKAMAAHVGRASDRRKGLEDVLWALLNAKEFILRR